ncbi:hypothetical protein ACB376_27105 [Klebsiella electrica]
MLPGNKTILARVIASVTIFVVIVLSGIYLQAGFSSPSRNITGDAQLVRFMTPFLRGARGHVAVALIKPGGVQYGLWGGDFSQEFEVGSLSKTMTAALLADAENRGEVKPETTVGGSCIQCVDAPSNVVLTFNESANDPVMHFC